MQVRSCWPGLEIMREAMEASARIRGAGLALLVAMACCVGFAQGAHGSGPSVSPTSRFDYSKCPTAGFGCDVVITPPHATMTLSGAGNGLVAMTFQCASGMHLVGSDTMVCHPGDGDGQKGVWRRTSNGTSLVATPPVCAVCPSADFSRSPTGSCYKLAQTSRGEYVNTRKAQVLCEDIDAQLVSINDADEQAAVIALVEEARSNGARIRDIVIGLFATGGESKDYHWLQQPKAALTYTNWEAGEPQHGFRGVVLSSEGEKWTSVDETFIYGDYICEEKAIVRCAVPPTIKGGSVHYRNTSHPYGATYSCSKGYELKGSVSFKCGDTGLWTDDAGKVDIPTCQPITCHPPHHLNSPTIVSTSKAGDVFHYESVVEYTCATGFRLRAGHRGGVHIVTKANGYRFGSLRCQADGTWSDGRVVKCEPCDCNGEFTTSDVCDWESGECLCDGERHAEGARCSDCTDGYFRAGTDDTVACRPCGCGVGVTKGDTCNKRTGECNCVAGCYGDCNIPQCNLYCDAETVVSLQGVLEWEKTGVTSKWTVDCPLGPNQACNDTEGCRGQATRSCSFADGAATWLPAETGDCRYEDQLTEEINNLLNVNISVGNVVGITNKLSAVAGNKTNISSADILISTSLLEAVVSTRSSDATVGQGLLGTVAALGNASVDVLAEQGEMNTTNRLLAVIDDYAVHTPLISGETERSINVSGIAMSLRDVNPARVPETVRLDFPAVAASLPDRLFTDGDLNRNVRLQATVFSDSSLFVRRRGGAAVGQAHTTAASTTAAQDDRRVAGGVLSLTLGGIDTSDLASPVNVTFAPPAYTSDQARDPTCVYWDFELSDWSSRGCALASGDRRLRDGEQLVCTCSHLTHFAILMDFSPQKSSKHTVVLQWVTYIGLALSLAGLIGTFFVLGCYPKIRRQQQMKILLQLCSAWTGAIVAFIIGGELPSHRGACATFAILLHYFLLVVFMWTLAQAIFLYMALVLVYTEGVKAKFRKAIFICWGVPALVVAITVGATKAEAYMPQPDKVNVCVLNIVNAKAAFIAAYLTPICVILATNLVFFTLVLRRIIKPRPGMATRQLEDHKRDAKISISLAVLLGLTWLTGIGMIGDARIAFAYIFTFLNAFLGFFIFLMHFAMRHEVVDEFRRSVSNKRMSFSSSMRSTSSRQITKASFISDANTSLRADSMSSGAGMRTDVIDELRRQQSNDATTTTGNGNGNGGWRPIKSVVSRPSQPLYSAVRKGSLDSDASGDGSGSAVLSDSQQSQRTTPEKGDVTGDGKAPLPAISPTSARDDGCVDGDGTCSAQAQDVTAKDTGMSRQDAVAPSSSPEVDV